jgi:NhaA family Na+:H+ antiporter
MRIVDLVVIGCVAAIGFTVSLFVACVAVYGSPVQDVVKMGALFSFATAIISFTVGKLLCVEKQNI